jgi:hypothetical protein
LRGGGTGGTCLRANNGKITRRECTWQRVLGYHGVFRRLPASFFFSLYVTQRG